jgi:hypothetical protein
MSRIKIKFNIDRGLIIKVIVEFIRKIQFILIKNEKFMNH